MGNKRIIDGKIRSSQTFIKLTYRQRDLWQGIIVAADDQGRMPGSAMAVRSAVWPEDDILTADVDADLKVLESIGNIIRYEVDGSLYIQIVNWWKYQGGSQWMSASDYPAPCNWRDRARYHSKGNLITLLNWDKAGGFVAPKSAQDSRLDSGLDSALSRRDGDVNGDTEGDIEGDSDVEEENATTGNAQSPEKQPNVFVFYEQNIGALTPMIAEKLKDAEKDYPAEWIPAAFEVAVQNNARNWAYVKAILDRWKVDGFKVDKRQNGNGGQRMKAVDRTSDSARSRYAEE